MTLRQVRLRTRVQSGTRIIDVLVSLNSTRRRTTMAKRRSTPARSGTQPRADEKIVAEHRTAPAAARGKIATGERGTYKSPAMPRPTPTPAGRSPRAHGFVK